MQVANVYSAVMTIDKVIMRDHVMYVDQHQVAVNPQIKSTDLSRESACKLLSSTPTTDILLLLRPKAESTSRRGLAMRKMSVRLSVRLSNA